MPSPHRVVVTGIGPICAIGIGREDFTSGLSEGREGRRAPERLQGEWPDAPLLAECLDFVVEDYLETEKTYLDRCSELVLASCALVLQDAGLAWRELAHDRFGLAVGTAFGCLDSMHTVTARVQAKGLRFASPMIFTHSFANSPASLAAIEYQIEGPVTTTCTGDTSAATALQFAFDLVRWGRADLMLAGGADALSEPLLSALDAAGGLPSGRVPAEGACLWALESARAAEARGAKVLAELAGVGLGTPQVAAEAAATDAGLNATPDVFSVPESYGHTFGACMALDGASAMVRNATDRLIVATDPGGRGAALALRGAK